MPETVTDIIIDASVDKVWQVLSDFAAYPEWNPYIRRMDGSLESGGSLHVTRLLPGRGEVTSTPAITLYRPGREIRLLDRPVLPGPAGCRARAQARAARPGAGALRPLADDLGAPRADLRRLVHDGLRGQLDAMNVALKGMAEHGPLDSPESPDEVATGFARSRGELVSAMSQPA